MLLPRELELLTLDTAVMTADTGISAKRWGTMGGIFVLSLCAVSFPRLRVHKIQTLLFVGKHFGTGVILSTAFVHLLQDAFEALTSQTVRREYGEAIGKQAGLVVLGSLLAIFLVEYISMTYVDHMHGEPPTPRPSSPAVPDEETPLLHDGTLITTRPDVGRRHTMASHLDSPRLLHGAEHSSTHPHPLSSLLLSSPRHSRSTEGFYIISDLGYHVNSGSYHAHVVGGGGGPGEVGVEGGGAGGGKGKNGKPCICVCVCTAGEERELRCPGAEEGAEEHLTPHALTRRRQLVSLLVLQLGIMIHSLVIGLTLAITHGAEFVSLGTAVCFHQAFEGIGLGVRVGALPPPSTGRSSWLPLLLSLLFAVTTPFGMLLGMVFFPTDAEGGENAKMVLLQGVMSAVSAGMLIYAGAVEMLGGDFVFAGGAGHEHGHDVDPHGDEHEHGDEDESTPRHKVIAVLSLLSGVLVMGLVGLGE